MAIKVFRSDQLGAPILTGTAGRMVDLLYAALCTGYGQVNVSSITRSGTTATATTATEHGLATGDSALIAGATQTEYNLDAVVTVLTPTTFTFQVAGSPATPATGTITCKRAPGGWERAYTYSMAAGRTDVFRSLSASSNKHYLQVRDDTSVANGRQVQICGYEAMTDALTGTGKFPTLSANYFITKSSTADDTGQRAWVIVTDGKIAYIFVVTNAADPTNFSATGYSCGYFGDIIPTRAGDAYSTVIAGQTAGASYTAAANGSFASASSITAPTTFTVATMPRAFTGIAGAVNAQVFGSTLTGAVLGSAVAISYPHYPDNGFYMAPVLLANRTPNCIRGRMPGLYEPLHGRTLGHAEYLENVQGFAGRKFLHMNVQDGSTAGCVLVDVTGPWEF